MLEGCVWLKPFDYETFGPFDLPSRLFHYPIVKTGYFSAHFSELLYSYFRYNLYFNFE